MRKMPNKYDKPLFVALDELMKHELYASVQRVINTALENVPSEEEQAKEEPQRSN